MNCTSKCCSTPVLDRFECCAKPSTFPFKISFHSSRTSTPSTKVVFLPRRESLGRPAFPPLTLPCPPRVPCSPTSGPVVPSRFPGRFPLFAFFYLPKRGPLLRHPLFAVLRNVLSGNLLLDNNALTSFPELAAPFTSKSCGF